MCENERLIGNGHWGSLYTSDPAMGNVLIRKSIAVLSDWILEEAQRIIQRKNFERALQHRSRGSKWRWEIEATWALSMVSILSRGLVSQVLASRGHIKHVYATSLSLE